MSEENYTLTESVQIAPFRSVEEFLLDKARFQMPTFGDVRKWNNRVVTNLLYYQTNYFAISLLLVVFCGFMHASDILVGATAVGLLGAVIGVAISKNPHMLQMRAEHPYVLIGAVAIAGYYFIYVLPSVITLLFTLSFPVLLVFVHASVRLRNFSAKVNIKMEQMKMRQTLMSQLLDAMNVSITEG